jgi:S-adenosylmethionine decarboxylase proenzyme
MTGMEEVVIPAVSAGYLGRQVLVELYGCPAARLADVPGVEAAMREAAARCGATVVQSTFHAFSPCGVSGVVIIAESHLTIHTWPEYGYAAVDLFTCGANLDAEAGVEALKEALGATHSSVVEVQRGARRHMQPGPAISP